MPRNHVWTGRNGQLKRQWSILKTIASNRYTTIQKLAREYRCDEKTIRRDLAALKAVGFPLYYISDSSGDYFKRYYRLDRNWLDLNGVKTLAVPTVEARV